VLISHPSVARVLQFTNGGMHSLILQRLFRHVASAFGNEQPLPHAPQFNGSLAVFTSQPFDVSWSQFWKAPRQLAISHELKWHRWPAFGRLQTNPQVPQLSVFWVMFTSQALEGSPSQFAKLALHVPNPHSP
jgi:hypothetical protein